VEVDSGTLQLAQFQNNGAVNVYGTALIVTSSGSSVDRHYEFTNGARINASLTWAGENTANGNGVLAVGGNIAAGTTATFTNSQFTNGAQLEVGSGYAGSLSVDTGAVLTLNMTGSQQATMVGGNLKGPGTTINQGNFAWSGGNIGDSTGTVVNQGSLQWTGGALVGNGLTNQGNITINGNAAIGVDSSTIWSQSLTPGALTNTGTINHTAGGSLNLISGSLNNLAGAVYDMQGDVPINSYYYWYNPCSGSGTINNAGLFRKSAGSGTSSIAPTIVFNNTGTVEVDSGTLSIQGGVTQLVGNTLTGGTWNVKANSTLNITTGENITTNQGNISLDGLGSTFIKINTLEDNQGSLSIMEGRNFTTLGNLANSGTLTVGTGSNFTVNGDLTGTGNTIVDGIMTADSIVQNMLTIGAGGIVTIMPLGGGPMTGGDFSSVPEPSTLVLIGIAAVSLLAIWQRRK
jgi:hypothetical protein